MDNSISFITCVNNEIMYKECVAYIDNLHVPQGYKVEKIAIRNAKSLTSAYNEGMRKSASKYKIYLHQDVFIINKDFIYDMLNVFKDKTIGMFGSIGVEKLPDDGIWWNGVNKYGKVYDTGKRNMRILDFDASSIDTQEVEAIDGLIMVTQYDVIWREDLFKGWHFYDVAQCQEFRKKGYRVCIPYQKKPWYIHDCGGEKLYNGFKENRKIFLEEYKN